MMTAVAALLFATAGLNIAAFRIQRRTARRTKAALQQIIDRQR